jgi:hypothetical protein
MVCLGALARTWCAEEDEIHASTLSSIGLPGDVGDSLCRRRSGVKSSELLVENFR